MSRRYEEDLRRKVKGLLSAEAERIASGYDLPVDTVKQLLAETAVGDDLQTPIVEFCLDERISPNELSLTWIQFTPDFQDAADALGSQAALSLFHEHGVKAVSEFESASTLLDFKWGLPLLAYDNWNTLLRDFIGSQQLNREHLLQTGLPLADFSRSRWFLDDFAKLYPVKEVSTTTGSRRSGGDHHREYGWVPGYLSDGSPCLPLRRKKPSTECHQTEMLTRYMTESGTDGTPVSYSQAPYDPSFGDANAEYLENLREKVFDCKVGLLDIFKSSFSRVDEAGLWDGCMRVLNQHLSSTEVQFLLRMDVLHYGSPAKPGRLQSGDYDAGYMGSGGLSDIFGLIGYCEKELRIGTIAKTLENYPQFFTWYLESRDPLFPFGGYYDARAVWGAETDRMLADLAEMHALEEQYWVDFENRVSTTCLADFSIDIDIKIRVGAAGLRLLDREDQSVETAHDVDPNFPKIASDVFLRESSKEQPPGFTHGPDYRSIRKDGKLHVLTPTEAQVIQLLHEAHLSGTPELGLPYLINEVKGSESCYRRLRDIFRNREAREALICRRDTQRYRATEPERVKLTPDASSPQQN